MEPKRRLLAAAPALSVGSAATGAGHDVVAATVAGQVRGVTAEGVRSGKG